jgi:hypothetical protein
MADGPIVCNAGPLIALSMVGDADAHRSVETVQTFTETLSETKMVGPSQPCQATSGPICSMTGWLRSTTAETPRPVVDSAGLAT